MRNIDLIFLTLHCSFRRGRQGSISHRMQSSAGGASGGSNYEDVAAARRGRFRVTSSTPQGPPETTLGRFRLMPTCKLIWYFFAFTFWVINHYSYANSNWYLWVKFSIINAWCWILIPSFAFAANYGAISPILQRGRFAVIPEEPQAGSPALGTPPPGGRTARSPSPEWDFDIEQVSVPSSSAGIDWSS